MREVGARGATARSQLVEAMEILGSPSVRCHEEWRRAMEVPRAHRRASLDTTLFSPSLLAPKSLFTAENVEDDLGPAVRLRRAERARTSRGAPGNWSRGASHLKLGTGRLQAAQRF